MDGIRDTLEILTISDSAVAALASLSAEVVRSIYFYELFSKI